MAPQFSAKATRAFPPRMQAIFGSLWSNEEKYPHTDRKCAYRSEKLEITQVKLTAVHG